MIQLPTSKIPATSTNPHFLILYGRPKAGNVKIFQNIAVYIRNDINNYRANTGKTEMLIPW